jgi:amino acid adenylation domain-containing protein
VPLSFAQQRLWFLQRLDPESAQYNVRIALRLRGELNVDALDRALCEIVRRHEVLRTTLAMDGGHVAPAPSTMLRRVSFDDLPAEAHQPFDLEHGPLVRAALARVSGDEHALLIAMHHVVSDGWSMRIFARELEQLYAGASLPELPVQYADYAAWQQCWMNEAVLAGQVDYWRKQLASVVPIELPTKPRPAVAEHAGTRMLFRIDREIADSLRELSRREGTTLFMTLLGAFTILLHRYTGSDDIAVGTPIAGRTAKESEDLIGFFVNTLVMRTAISADLTVREVLAQVRETALEAYDNQDVPFEKLVDELAPQRDLSRTPLFEVMFAMQNGEAEWKLAGLDVTKDWIATSSEKFDLTLVLEETEDGLKGAIGYRTALFDAEAIERMQRHLARLLDAIARNADARIGELALHEQTIEEWSGTTRAYDTDSTLHERFEAQVRRTPDAEAVVCGDDSLSFAELNRRANRLARALRQRGVGVETAVGISMERSTRMIVSLLAILKAGGAYVPLDPNAPAERNEQVLREANVNIVLTGAAWEYALDQDDTDLASGATADNLAYVIFTSGSTGTPKGVAITHRSVLNLEAALAEQIEPCGVRVGVNAPIVFDASVKQIVQILNGAALVIVPEDVRQSPQRFVEYIEEKNIDRIDCTPSHAQLLPDANVTFLIGGEKISDALWRRLTNAYNVYGPTECTVDAALTKIQGEKPVIGKPLHNAKLYVLDAAMQPVPIGVAGELYIGGAGVARGYVNRSDLTAERFVPSHNGERLYRTGDLVRWTAGGELEYLGRIDHQVKLRGYRIELGEIEAVLGENAVVLVKDERLVAYVVDANIDALKAKAKQHLPEYMQPSVYVVVEEIPLTVNGKVDRRKLLAIEIESEAAPTYVAPRTPIEDVLAEVMAEVLRRERVGVHDNFFHLGGHSLLAMQFVAEVSDILRIDLPLRHLFLAPTVAGLAELLVERQATPGALESLAALYETIAAE